MIHPRNTETELSPELFENPGSEYRALPFWGWNGKLEAEELTLQIEAFKQMGMGGFHMHARAGLATEYLSDEFMDCVKLCCEKAESEGLFAWLYDEDKYPSGPAGGIVTRNPDYTRRYIRFTPWRYGDEPAGIKQGSFPRSSDGKLLACYDIQLDDEGYLLEYKTITAGSEAIGRCWYAYLEAHAASTAEKQSYVDALNPKAIEEFARVTYDRYKESVGEYFSTVSPAIFTDEPQYATETVLTQSTALEDITMPWTNDFAETFKNEYNADILAALPEVIWNSRDKLSRLRLCYHDHIAERFVSAFCDTLGDWCTANGILFTGHVMSEDTLAGQTMRSGEAMRCYRAFHIPGIDVLGTHKLEYNTAKQAQSAVRQQGSCGMMSELYGVSGWDFDFRGFKLQGDWQAACGVNVRVPHHSWYTMRGEGKRDYPGSISYQAPWWREYHLIEDHFARLAAALSRGTPEVSVGVIHPIESVWINFGPNNQSGAVVSQLEQNFSGLINALTEGLIDFDFISEARLPQLCPVAASPLTVGEMRYDIIVVPALHTIRTSTLERLCEFKRQGGRLIFLGDCPGYLDGEKSDEIAELYCESEHFGFEAATLVARLDNARFVDARLPDGNRALHLIHTLRRDRDSKWLFLATTRGQPSPDVDIPNQAIKFNVGQRYEAEVLTFTLAGEYLIEEYNTQTGEIKPLAAQYKNGRTIFKRRWYMHDSLLLCLIPGRNEGESEISVIPARSMRVFDKVSVQLDEPNVLLLDMAEYSLDGGEFRQEEELLRLDNICRGECGLPQRKRAIPQPYQIKDSDAGKHSITMRFRLESELEIKAPQLALESPQSCKITLNGANVDTTPTGFYVDRSIETIALPPLNAGENILEVTLFLTRINGPEYLYLLGDFGVRVAGTKKRITKPVRELAFGDWVHQGLPFYSGNVTYCLEAECGACVLRVPHYRGALMRAWVDGIDRGEIIYSPYALKLEDLEHGHHKIEIKLYGTRQNAFAQLHHLGSIPYAQGPDSWRSVGDLWNYEYSFSEKGIMSSPRIYPAE